MKIDVLGVQAFVAIADERSFTPAARSLHITQTALTRRLQNLESFLGVQLIERTTRSLALTLVGENFLPQARRLLIELQSSLQEIRDTGQAMRGDVTIACVPTIGVRFLPRVIQAYASRLPDNRILVLDHSSAGVAQAVLRREAEFGIGIAGSHSGDLDFRHLLTDRFVLVCRDDHALASRRSMRWADLHGETLILPGQGSSNGPLLEAGLAGTPVRLRSRYEVQRSSTAVGLVSAGVGVAVVPELALQEGVHPRLNVIALREPTITRSFVLLTRQRGSLSPAAAALFELIGRQATRAKAR